MSNAVTTAIAPSLEAASVAISASIQPPAPNVTTSLALPNEAPDDLESSDLSPAQLTYLHALVAGRSITAAAEEAGVTRKTAYRWQSEPHFVAMLNTWRNHTMEAARAQLLALAEQATATVARAIQKGDVRVAMALLKGLGILSPKVSEHASIGSGT